MAPKKKAPTKYAPLGPKVLMPNRKTDKPAPKINMPLKPSDKPGVKVNMANKDNGLIQAITNGYRVTAKEAAQIVKTIKESKPVLGPINPVNEAAKFIGGAVKANAQLPGKVAGMAARTAKNAGKSFKQGFK
jgi:hypothetical protein